MPGGAGPTGGAAHIGRLVAHLGWADARTRDALAGSAPAADPLDRFAHILGAEHVWISRILGRPPTVPVWPKLSLDESSALADANLRELTELASGLTAADLDRPIRYVNSAGAEFVSRLEDMIFQVCLHGHYHRGQIALELRQQGQVPIPTDYIAFTRGAPAATTARS